MLGISMGQRNPFMMPLFAGKFAGIFGLPNSSRIRRFLPLEGVIRQDLLLDHVRKVMHRLLESIPLSM
jgi:hypothetical protein